MKSDFYKKKTYLVLALLPQLREDLLVELSRLGLPLAPLLRVLHALHLLGPRGHHARVRLGHVALPLLQLLVAPPEVVDEALLEERMAETEGIIQASLSLSNSVSLR